MKILTNSINDHFIYFKDTSSINNVSEGFLWDGKIGSFFEQFHIFEDDISLKRIEKSSSKPYGDLDMNNYLDDQYNRASAKERSVLLWFKK